MTDTCIISQPVYHDLVESLEDRITQGKVRSGQMLGTELGFAKDAGISRVSARRAVDQLVEAGLVERRAGKGVFVVDNDNAVTPVIEVIVPSLDHDQWVETWKGVRNYSAGIEGKILPRIYDAHGSSDYHIEHIRKFADRGVAGAIIGHLSHPQFAQVIFDLNRLNFPFVLVDSPMDNLPVATVYGDHYGGGYIAGKELVKLGHRRIGFIGNVAYTTGRLRSDGLRDGILDSGLTFDRSLVLDLNIQDPLSDWAPAIRTCVQQAVKRDNPPTALLLNNDAVAVTVYDELEKLGLKVPDDISIVGFGGETIGKFLTPPLTTVSVNHKQVGATAIEMLIGMLDGAPGKQSNNVAKEQIIKAHWLPRQSTKALKVGNL